MICVEATASKRSTQTVLKNEIQFKRGVESSMRCVTLAHFPLSQLRPDGNKLNLPLVHLSMGRVNLYLLVRPNLDSIHYSTERSHPVVNRYQRSHLQQYSQSQIGVSNRSTSDKQLKSQSWSIKECRNSQSLEA